MFKPDRTPRVVSTLLWEGSSPADDDLIRFATILNEAIALYGADSLELDVEYEGYEFTLIHNREETPGEIENRIKQQKLDWERGKDYRRKQFENLKKEFSNEP